MTSQLDTAQILDDALKGSKVSIINVHQFYAQMPVVFESEHSPPITPLVLRGDKRFHRPHLAIRSRFLHLGHNTTELDEIEPLGASRALVWSLSNLFGLCSVSIRTMYPFFNIHHFLSKIHLSKAHNCKLGSLVRENSGCLMPLLAVLCSILMMDLKQTYAVPSKCYMRINKFSFGLFLFLLIYFSFSVEARWGDAGTFPS